MNIAYIDEVSPLISYQHKPTFNFLLVIFGGPGSAWKTVRKLRGVRLEVAPHKPIGG